MVIVPSRAGNVDKMMLVSPKLSQFANCHVQKITCPDAATDKSFSTQITTEKLDVDKERTVAGGSVNFSLLGS